jgi:GNAT superfamily N-acetyltransferase
VASAEWLIEPLGREHERSAFDCSEPALNEYLLRYAHQNQKSGIARTFVAVAEIQPRRVIGYYALTVAGIDKANLPAAAAKRFSNYPLPVVRLARLAVDRSTQGQGLGEDLLMDALQRSLRIANEVGIVAVLIDAKHERAKRFYARYEFGALPDQPLVLWLPMATVRRLFGQV